MDADVHFSEIDKISRKLAKKDPNAESHSRRVTRIALSLCRKMGRLTRKEYQEIRRHPVIGAEIAEKLGVRLEVRDVIRHHHERFDGKGYPDGLQGREIPILARILSVADTYDALVSDRSYRHRQKSQEAISIIRRQSGRQFDPGVVEAFVNLNGDLIDQSTHQKIN